MNADRPWTKILTIESGKGAGKKVMAQPVWGEDHDPIPAGIHVTVNSDLGEKVIGKIDGPLKASKSLKNLRSSSLWNGTTEVMRKAPAQ